MGHRGQDSLLAFDQRQALKVFAHYDGGKIAAFPFQIDLRFGYGRFNRLWISMVSIGCQASACWPAAFSKDGRKLPFLPISSTMSAPPTNSPATNNWG